MLSVKARDAADNIFKVWLLSHIYRQWRLDLRMRIVQRHFLLQAKKLWHSVVFLKFW